MRRPQLFLILAGIACVAVSMLYGFYYAVFDEHQTLEQIGVSMATGFVKAAEGDMAAAHSWLQTYATTRIEYLREVHAHGHLGALGTLLIVVAVLLPNLLQSVTRRTVVAVLLTAGTVLLPLGAWAGILFAGEVSSLLSVFGAVFLIVGFAVVAASLLFESARP